MSLFKTETIAPPGGNRFRRLASAIVRFSLALLIAGVLLYKLWIAIAGGPLWIGIPAVRIPLFFAAATWAEAKFAFATIFCFYLAGIALCAVVALLALFDIRGWFFLRDGHRIIPTNRSNR